MSMRGGGSKRSRKRGGWESEWGRGMEGEEVGVGVGKRKGKGERERE